MSKATLQRNDEVRVSVVNRHEVPATLFANAAVPVDGSAVQELGTLLELAETVENLRRHDPGFFGDLPAAVERVAVTPDFHKGAGIPIGTVLATSGFMVPQAIGNDVNCGMRLHVTGYREGDLEGKLGALEKRLRHIFFEGGRNIAMTHRQRAGLLHEGLAGLHEATDPGCRVGIWEQYHAVDQLDELTRVQQHGSLAAGRLSGLDDYIGGADLRHDDQIGQPGGGNHFVELQVVEKVLDGTTAHAWGLARGQVVVMAHSGSLSVGHLAGGICRDVVKAIYPAGLPHPANGIYPMPVNGRHADRYAVVADMISAAANFAFGNRLFLALMALTALREVCGEAESRLLYDAPHNLAWDIDGGQRFVHRKGACPARGMESMAGGPYEWYGEPVLIPGSMGASSFILAGLGNDESLCSASHGAGRQLSRGQAARVSDEEFKSFLDNFRVVMPIDLADQGLRQRPDILAEKLNDLKMEAPYAYKGIGPVIDTIRAAGIARPVVELRPLLTVKG